MTLQRGERHIKVANGIKAEVKAIEKLPLELNDGFVLKLTNVLYVPSLRRNLISVSRLDDDRFDYYFSNDKCKIMFNHQCVGLAFRQDELYLLSLCKNVNSVCDVNEKVSSSNNANRKRKRTPNVSSKLWHCRLGHISRRRIER